MSPIQKSTVERALRPSLNQTTSVQPTAVTRPSSATEPRRSKPRPSSRKAMPGCSIESEEVMAAMKSRVKNSPPKRCP